MNKEAFVNELMSKTNYNEEKCKKINDILESHFIIGKNQKNKILNDFIDLGLSSEEADNLYNICVSILGNGLKNKLKHPFKSKD